MAIQLLFSDVTGAVVSHFPWHSCVTLIDDKGNELPLFVTPAQADAIAAVFAPVEPVDVEGVAV